MSTATSPRPTKTLIKKGTNYASSPNLKLNSPKLGDSSARSPNKTLGLSIFSPEDMSYHNLSSSILQHASLAYKFPQADRFPRLKTPYAQSYVSSPSSIGNRATTMGFGNRTDVAQYCNKESVKYPSPDRYNLTSEFDQKDKGKTFGLPYSAYERIYIPGNPNVPLSVTKDLPGPGAYYMPRDPVASMSKITLKPKGKMFNEDIIGCSPKCNQYSPKSTLVQSARFAKPTFGFGDKYDFTKSTNSYPGPGAYTPKSFVDKYRKREIAIKIGNRW
jgi:hypothetical protein